MDYTASPLVSQLAKMEPFDLVLDCIGVLSLYRGSAKFLKPKRLYLNIGLDLHGLSTAQSIGAFLQLFRLAYLPGFMGGAGRKIQIYSTMWDQKALVELAEMVAAGQIHVPIDGEYGWEKEDVMKAYKRQMSARVSAEYYLTDEDIETYYRPEERLSSRCNGRPERDTIPLRRIAGKTT